jgi:16S rRNA (guanine527-N7)-methyltransferase
VSERIVAAALSPSGEGAARAFFGDRLGTAERFAEHLATTGVERGLLGPREVGRLWDRHLLNCAAVVELVPDGACVVDVGSGAGLPGLVMAIARPDLEVVLLEPLLRRVDWLSEVLAELELPGVRVLRGRAEELVGSVRAEVAVARAVAPLGKLAGWCVPLVAPGGVVLAVKGQSVQEELTRDAAELRAVGVVGWSVRLCGSAVLPEPTTVARLEVGDRGLRDARGGSPSGRPGPRRGTGGRGRR